VLTSPKYPVDKPILKHHTPVAQSVSRVLVAYKSAGMHALMPKVIRHPHYVQNGGVLDER
jgi:hypothetical protein